MRPLTPVNARAKRMDGPGQRTSSSRSAPFLGNRQARASAPGVLCVTGRYGRCRSVGASDCGCDPTDSTDILNPEIPPPEESLHFSFRHILLRHYIIVLSSSFLRVKVTRFFALILFLLLCSTLRLLTPSHRRIGPVQRAKTQLQSLALLKSSFCFSSRMKTLSLSALVALASGIQLAAADVCLPYILVYLKQIALNTGLTFYH